MPTIPEYDISKLDQATISNLAGEARKRNAGEGMSDYATALDQIRYEQLNFLKAPEQADLFAAYSEVEKTRKKGDTLGGLYYTPLALAKNYLTQQQAAASGTPLQEDFSQIQDVSADIFRNQGNVQSQAAQRALSLPAEGKIVHTGADFNDSGVDISAPPGTFAVKYENGAVEFRKLPASGRIPNPEEVSASGRAGADVGSVGKEVARTGANLANPKSGADVEAPEGKYVIEYTDGTYEFRDKPAGGFIPTPGQLRQGGDSSGAQGIDTAGKTKEELQREQGVFKEAAQVDNSNLEYIGQKYTAANGQQRVAPEGQAFYQDPTSRTILLRPDTGKENSLKTTSPSILASQNDIPGMFEAVYGRKPNAQEIKYWQGRTDKKGAALIGAMQFAKQEGKTVGGTPNAQAGGDPIAAINSSLNAGQEADFSALSAATNAVDLSSSAKLVERLTQMIGEKKDAPSLRDEYEKELLRSGYNEDAASLAEADRAVKQLDADFASLTQSEEGRLVSMSQVRRRQSAEQIAYDRVRRDLVVERDYLANQVANKQAVVNTMVSLTGQDIANAQAEYQNKIQNALSITNLVRGIEQDQLTAIQRQQDNARANVQVMSGLLASGNVKYSQLDSATKSQLKSMELQAGLPVGFTQFVSETVKDPEVQFLPAYTDINGVRIQPIATINPQTGAYTIKNINQGKVDLPAGSGKAPVLTTSQKEGQKFLEDTQGLQDKMISGDYNWQQAWDTLRTRYPSASVETIDNALGLSFRSKYNK